MLWSVLFLWTQNLCRTSMTVMDIRWNQITSGYPSCIHPMLAVHYNTSCYLDSILLLPGLPIQFHNDQTYPYCTSNWSILLLQESMLLPSKKLQVHYHLITMSDTYPSMHPPVPVDHQNILLHLHVLHQWHLVYHPHLLSY